jgi:proline iminopeptidase
MADATSRARGVTAWRLHRGWPGSVLLIDEGDGHGGSSMLEHWRAANNDLVARYATDARPA